MLTFQDADENTALHFGARNGNTKIVDLLLKEAKRVDYMLNESSNLTLL